MKWIRTKLILLGLVINGNLMFGDFTTKSGRRTPYFIDFGKTASGRALAQLGACYAKEMVAGKRQGVFGDSKNVLFGPAYKGIPIVCSAAQSLATIFDRDFRFCYNRKEVKDHGEGGNLIGTRLLDGDSVVILEDVTTAGTSVREAVPFLQSIAKIKMAGLLVCVDREEKGPGGQSALLELGKEFNMSVASILTITEIVDYLRMTQAGNQPVINDDCMQRIEEYWKQYKAA